MRRLWRIGLAVLGAAALAGAVFAALRGAPTPDASGSPRLRIEAAGPDLNAESCALRVVFGSHASGIDQGLLASVSAFVERAPGVERAFLESWGREGEKTLCLTAAPAAVERLRADLEAMILRTPPQNGWIQLEGAGFPPFPP